MTKIISPLIFGLIALVCVCALSCDFENPVLRKWWEDPAPGEPEYIPIIKNVPTSYQEIIIQHDVIYETIYETILEEQPPEIIYEIVYVDLPPEVITEVIYDTQYIEIEVVKEVVKEIEKVVTITQLPDKETFIQWLENDASEEDIKYIKEVIKEYLTIDDIIEIIKEFIRELEPQKLIEYLTDEQIKYIVQQQPPILLLQSIKIIDIEYIIFAGDSSTYNGPPGTAGGSALTATLKATNENIVNAAVKTLKDNPASLILLHGHANPVAYTPQEIADLTKLSEDRAKSVREKIIALYGPDADADLDGRMETKGFAGEGNISSASNAELNRRVEVILFQINTARAAGAPGAP